MKMKKVIIIMCFLYMYALCVVCHVRFSIMCIHLQTYIFYTHHHQPLSMHCLSNGVSGSTFNTPH